MRQFRTFERAAHGRPSPRTRARWLSLGVGAALVLLVGIPLVYRGLTDSTVERRQVSKAQYEQLVRTTYSGVQRAFRATNVRADLLAERVGAAQAELRTAADRLDAAVPPAEVRGEHVVIVDGLRQYADDLEEVRRAAADGDTRRISAFNRRLGRNSAVAKIAEAAESMKFKGYDLGPIAED